jgi:hypothetical protein
MLLMPACGRSSRCFGRPRFFAFTFFQK